MATKKAPPAPDNEYEFVIRVEQKTNGKVNGRSLVEEFSSDPNVHSIKTQVFTHYMTEALDKATKDLTDMAIAVNSGK